MKQALITMIDLPFSVLPEPYKAWLNAELVANGCADDLYTEGETVHDVHVEVTYECGWAQRGNRSGHPDNWTDDSGEPPEITSVLTVEGNHELIHLIPDHSALEKLAWEDQQGDPPGGRSW